MSASQERLAGKVALVTGGNSGLGLATASRLVRDGARVVVTGRRQVELDKAVAEIGAGATAVPADVAVASDLDRVFRAIHEGASKLDIVVANAGTLIPAAACRRRGDRPDLIDGGRQTTRRQQRLRCY